MLEKMEIGKTLVVRNKAYLLSTNEILKYLHTRIPAFTPPKLSKKALINGAWEMNEKAFIDRGCMWSRTSAIPDKSSATPKVLIVDNDGDILPFPSNVDGLCLPIAFQIIYNPKSSIVDSCHKVSRTSTLWNHENKQYELITSLADFVTIDDKDVIWLNKDECKNDIDKTMILYLPEAPNKAVPFDKEGKHSNYGLANELRKQCDDELFKYLSPRVKDLVVTIQMSSLDHYETVTPIIQKENEFNLMTDEANGKNISDK